VDTKSGPVSLSTYNSCICAGDKVCVVRADQAAGWAREEAVASGSVFDHLNHESPAPP